MKLKQLTTLLFTLLPLTTFALETVRVLNWSDYIDESVLESFTNSTGIEIVYETFDDEDEFIAAYFDADEPWDVIVPSDNLLAFLIARDQLSPISKSNIKDYSNLNPSIMAQLGQKDINNQYAVPYMWGTTGIGINTTAIGDIDITVLKQSGWSILFDQTVRSQFAECGIVAINDRNEIFAAALTHLGFSINTSEKSELEAAQQMVKGLAGDIRYYHSGNYHEDLASGDACIALGYSGDIVAEQYEMENADIEYLVPDSGGVMWIDVMAVPANSKNKQLAHTFISYLTEPQVAATNTNYNAYPNPLVNSSDWIDEEILNNPAVYPTQTVMAQLESFSVQDKRTRRLIRKFWVQANCQAGAFCEVPIDIYGY